MNAYRTVIISLVSLLLASPVLAGADEDIQAIRTKNESSRNMLIFTSGAPQILTNQTNYSTPTSFHVSYRRRLSEKYGLGVELSQINTQIGMPGYTYNELLFTYFRQYADLLGIGKIGWAISAGYTEGYFVENVNYANGPTILAKGSGGTVKWEIINASYPLGRAIWGKPEFWFAKIVDIDIFASIEKDITYVPLKVEKDFTLIHDEAINYKKGDSFHPDAKNGTIGNFLFSGTGFTVGVMWMF